MNKKMKMLLLGLTMALAIGGTGCQKRKVIVEGKPNQVLYEVSNFGEDGTQAFDGSRVDWSKSKSRSQMVIVDFKRISLSWMPFFGSKYIAEKKIIVATVSPLTKEWISVASKGSGQGDESFRGSSRQGTEFNLGITVEAKISNTDKYIEKYGIDPKATIDDVKINTIPLSTVMENTIRQFIQGQLLEEFGKIETGDCQDQKNEVMAKVRKATKEKFALTGIEILNFNISEDITWVKQNIQDTIDRTALSKVQEKEEAANQKVRETKAITKRLENEERAKGAANIKKINSEAEKIEAENERKKQDEVNEMNIAKQTTTREINLIQAQDQVDVANEKAKTLDVEKQIAEIERYKIETVAIEKGAETELIKARAWDGVQPYSKTTITGARAVVSDTGDVKTLQLSN